MIEDEIAAVRSRLEQPATHAWEDVLTDARALVSRALAEAGDSSSDHIAALLLVADVLSRGDEDAAAADLYDTAAAMRLAAGDEAGSLLTAGLAAMSRARRAGERRCLQRD